MQNNDSENTTKINFLSPILNNSNTDYKSFFDKYLASKQEQFKQQILGSWDKIFKPEVNFLWEADRLPNSIRQESTYNFDPIYNEDYFQKTFISKEYISWVKEGF